MSFEEQGRYRDWRGWAPGAFYSLGEAGDPYPLEPLMEDWPDFVQIQRRESVDERGVYYTAIHFDSMWFTALPRQIQYAIVLITAEMVIDCMTSQYHVAGQYQEAYFIPHLSQDVRNMYDDEEAYEAQGEMLRLMREAVEELFVAIQDSDWQLEETRQITQEALSFWTSNMDFGAPFVYGFFDRFFRLFQGPHTTRAADPTDLLVIAFMLLMGCNHIPFSQFQWQAYHDIAWRDYISEDRAEAISRALVQSWWRNILRRLAFRGW